MRFTRVRKKTGRFCVRRFSVVSLCLIDPRIRAKISSYDDCGDKDVAANVDGIRAGLGEGQAMKRWAFVILLLIVAGVAVLWVGNPLERVRAPIRVGLLHSLTGPMSISEKSMVDAEQLAIDEVNAQGGLLGRRVEWVVADGRSDPATFAREAARLIEDEKVSVIVGCWTSASRKAIKPVVERANHLLIFPVAYEGLEQSPNIIYTGAAPNQQIIPTVKWCRDFFKAKKFYLIGSDTFWPHAVNAIIQDQLKAFGVTLAGESYIEFGSSDVGPAITKALATKPDVILSMIEGDTNLAFYKKLRGAETRVEGPRGLVQRGRGRAESTPGRRNEERLLRLQLFPEHRPPEERGVRPEIQGEVRPGPRDERRDRHGL